MKPTKKKHKLWSWSAGKRGENAVRVFKDPKSEPLFVEFYETTSTGRRKRRRVALGHSDRDRAMSQALDIAAKLRDSQGAPSRPLTIGRMLTSYLAEVT